MTPDRRRRAVFLDRDGVLNRAVVRDGRPYPPRSVTDVEIIAAARDACRNLKEAGFTLICVTNQPDIARGTTTRADVEAINAAVRAAVDLDALMVCPHDEDDGCDCRKPRPGMLVSAARDLDIDLASSIMVGDRWRDIEAGRRAGCHTVFIDYGYDERRPAQADFECEGLAEAVPWILKR